VVQEEADEMCGLFGFVTTGNGTMVPGAATALIDALIRSSESRGKEASGIAVLVDDEIAVHKAPQRGRAFLRSKETQRLLARIDRAVATGLPSACIGHTRMVTNGDPSRFENNQPVYGDDLAIIHNGIITNEAEVWKENSDLARHAEVDTEVMLRLLERHMRAGRTLSDVMPEVIAQLEGGNSYAVLDRPSAALILSTANGSIYWAASEDGSLVCFASEHAILRAALSKRGKPSHLDPRGIRQLRPGTALQFAVGKPAPSPATFPMAHRRAVPGRRTPPAEVSPSLLTTMRIVERFAAVDAARIASLSRCTRCILPETFPGIHFDEQGVCSLCKAHQQQEMKRPTELVSLAGSDRKVLVPLSGGRDSCFGLHVAVRELGFDAVAYTYDWGMVTDLARRNISRMCGELGVEHILVSADIAGKLRNVRRNVGAWLRRPHLGTVPLFMSGDKQFFLHAQRLRRELELELVLLSANPYERTDFKVGFAGVRDAGEAKERGWDLGGIERAQLLAFYVAQALKNPAYLNPSLLDTAHAFFSYYLIPKRFESLYDYRQWDEQELESVLLDTYGWETAADTTSTWRIGDGTAPFYNYIYLRAAGFSENDTLRSNQVRAGHLSREEAVRRATEENAPRIESLAWYFSRIGVDAEFALRTINNLPALY
jgi:glutamine---fructose-6-phosphate transaminase (isomerizing)